LTNKKSYFSPNKCNRNDTENKIKKELQRHFFLFFISSQPTMKCFPPPSENSSLSHLFCFVSNPFPSFLFHSFKLSIYLLPLKDQKVEKETSFFKSKSSKVQLFFFETQHQQVSKKKDASFDKKKFHFTNQRKKNISK